VTDRTYFSYGLRIRADFDIPGLPPAVFDASADVSVRTNPAPSRPPLTRTPWYQSPQLNGASRPDLTIWRTDPGGDYLFDYDDGTEFLIANNGTAVRCSWPAAAAAADTAVYLRGPVLGFVLRLRGVLCLHASAVAVGDHAIAILGTGGRGKSTTAAALVQLGCPLLSDDLSALDLQAGQFHVRPGYPWLNLWPDAGEVLYGSATDLPRVAPAGGINDWWDKRRVALDTTRQFQSHPLPLAAVYVLAERSDDERTPHVGPLAPQEAFIKLTDETYANYAIDAATRAAEFESLGHLVRSTPVRLVTPHEDAARLPELCDAILRDCRERSTVAR